MPARMLLATSPMYRLFGYLGYIAGSMYVIGLWGAPYGIDRVSDSGGVGHRAGRMGSRMAVPGDEGGARGTDMAYDTVGPAWNWGD